MTKFQPENSNTRISCKVEQAFGYIHTDVWKAYSIWWLPLKLPISRKFKTYKSRISRKSLEWSQTYVG